MGRNFSFIFWENWKKNKKSLINWPLACPFPTLPKVAHNNYSLNDLWVTYKKQYDSWIIMYEHWKTIFLDFKGILETQFPFIKAISRTARLSVLTVKNSMDLLICCPFLCILTHFEFIVKFIFYSYKMRWIIVKPRMKP